jgi:hypothetical protein
MSILVGKNEGGSARAKVLLMKIMGRINLMLMDLVL